MHLNVNSSEICQPQKSIKGKFLCFSAFNHCHVVFLSTFFPDVNERYWLLLHNENWCLKPTDTVLSTKRQLYHFSLRADNWISFVVIQKLISLASPWKPLHKRFIWSNFYPQTWYSHQLQNTRSHDTTGLRVVHVLTHLHTHFTWSKWQLLIGK